MYTENEHINTSISRKEIIPTSNIVLKKLESKSCSTPIGKLVMDENLKYQNMLTWTIKFFQILFVYLKF